MLPKVCFIKRLLLGGLPELFLTCTFQGPAEESSAVGNRNYRTHWAGWRWRLLQPEDRITVCLDSNERCPDSGQRSGTRALFMNCRIDRIGTSWSWGTRRR